MNTTAAKESDSEEQSLIQRLAQANAEAAELVAELEESKEQLERSNRNLAAANARSAELVAELHDRRDELEWANANLKEAFEENKRILGVAAHDIRSGISGIAATAELLSQVLVKNSGEAHTEATLIHKESHRLLDLLEGLLDTSSTGLGRIKIRPGTMDLDAILQNSRNMQERLASQKFQTIELTTRATPIIVLADAIRIRQVLDNLLSNAIKFSPLHASITIATNTLDGIVQVSIADEGPGLTEADLAKVFSEFTQLSAKPTANEQSHGIGLSIVKRIIELHRGRVWAENRADRRGARFCFTLPLALESTRACQILAVDDQALNRHLVKKLLESRGHTVETCRSGLEALEVLKHRSFDLVLMDVEMPDMSGLEATRIIRSKGQDEAHLPIIAVTAHSDPGHLSQCLDSGMNEALQKPIDRGDLDRMVAKWIPKLPHPA